MRKSGFWRRALIVLAAIWIVIGGSFGWNHAYDDVDAKFKQCVTANPADLPVCRDARNNALAVPRGVAAAIVAFGPILILWLVFYALLRLSRWFRRDSQSRAGIKSEPGAS
jgi:hypothetical protein